MNKVFITDAEIKRYLRFEQNECNSAEIYKRLGQMSKSEYNKRILLQMASEETDHYKYIVSFTNKELPYNRLKVILICIIVKILGLTFTLKLLEKGESDAGNQYTKFTHLAKFAATEDKHEHQLLDMIDEQRLKYMGSIVLGLNDALVEFTGALAGYTLALSNNHFVALTGGITGIAAAMSMGASEYLSTKSEGTNIRHALISAIYTSITYLITVFFLIAPYIWTSKPILASLTMLIIAVIIIAIFNFYYSVVRNEPFSKRFGEMTIISFSVAILSFFIGYLLKIFTGIEI